jgi:hypothetical protein
VERRTGSALAALAAAAILAVIFLRAPAPGPAGAALVDETPGTDVVTGEVIGLTCFMAHGGRGPEHAACAAECLNKGLPAGILTADGKVWVVTMSDHTAPGPRMASLAAKQVRAVGRYRSGGGNQIFEVATFVRAAGQ